MRFYPVFPLKVNGSCLELGFHYPEAFFYFPAFLIDVYHFSNIHVIKIGTNCVESIIFFFFSYDVCLEIWNFFCTCLAIFSHDFLSDKSVWIILILGTLFIFSAVDNSCCPVYLPLSDLTLIDFVFGRVGDYKVLL